MGRPPILKGKRMSNAVFDREAWAVVVFGWAVALWATLC
jgi:hypothetical protein